MLNTNRFPDFHRVVCGSLESLTFADAGAWTIAAGQADAGTKGAVFGVLPHKRGCAGATHLAETSSGDSFGRRIDFARPTIGEHGGPTLTPSRTRNAATGPWWRPASRRVAGALVTLLAMHPVHAVTCQNNLPPSNPDSAYVVHGDGTATDTRSGLMWKVCNEGKTWSIGACTGTATTHTWAAALALAEGTVYAGYSDWRLPNLKELRSLVEECSLVPAINAAVFPTTDSSYVWSGSIYANQPSLTWFVSFGGGDPYVSNRSDANQVRLVRGGPKTSGLAPVAYFPLQIDARNLGSSGGGTPSGQVQFVGGVARFSSGYIDAPAALNRDTSLTVTAWVKPTTINTTGAHGVLWERNGGDACGANSSGNYGVSIYTGRFAFDVATVNAAQQCGLVRLFAPTTALNGVWQHVAGTYATGTGIVRLYVDGASVASSQGAPSLRTEPGVFLSLGRNPGAPQPYFGDMSDVRVYDRMLSDAEIAALASSPPVADVVAPALSAVSFDTTTAIATSNEAATGYWIVVARGATAPTAAQVKAGVTYSSVTVLASGSGAMAAGTPTTFNITGLNANILYDFYVVAEDAAGNASMVAKGQNTVDAACVSSTVATIEFMNLSASMTANAVINLGAGALRTTFNVTCANGRFGVVRLPKTVSGLLGGDAYALVQSSCATKPVQRMASPPATVATVAAALSKKSSQVDLLNDALVGPLAGSVCE